MIRWRGSYRSGRGALGAVVVAAAAAALVVGLVPTAGAAVTASGKVTYPDSVPGWATHAADAGGTPADTTVEGEVFLALRDEAGARALALGVSTPGSNQYGRYVSPRQWIKRFAPTRKAFNAVEAYLRQSGLTIYATPKSRQYIVFRGPASAVGPAFGTTLHEFHFDGGLQHAPSSVPALPKSVGADVAGLSIDSGRMLTRPDHLVPDGSQPTSGPKAGAQSLQAAAGGLPNYACSSYYGQHSGTTPKAYGRTEFPTALCGYLPDQLRSGYDLNKLITSGDNGSGQTIAIIDAYASPSIQQDVNDYMVEVGSPLLTKFRQIKPKAFVDTELCQEPSGWQTEETLDVESSHSIAPGAAILYVGGFNCGGGLDIAMSQILDNHLANIVSNSYGDLGEAVPGSVLTGEQNLHMQAAAEGIGLYFSSGDSGDETINLGYVSPDFPATSPFVTAVGGTSKAIGADGATEFNTGWGDARQQIVLNKKGKPVFAGPLPGDFWAGAGGGTSAVYAQPAYQQGVVPNSLADAADGSPSRVVPDVAALADPYTGFQIAYRPIDDSTCTPSGQCQVGALVYQTYGGTSLASPITAAQMAIVQQVTGRTIGFANPALYAAYRAAPDAFQDVVPPARKVALVRTSVLADQSLLDRFITLDQDSSLRTAKGYDNVTGLGELSVSAIAAAVSGRQ